jgi:hypothetical protein
MTSRLSLETKRFDLLMQAKPNSKAPRSDNSLTFDRLRAKCDNLQVQIEDAWTEAKTESFSRCQTLDEILKISQAATVRSWMKDPEYLRFQTRMLQNKGSSSARQMNIVEDVLNESKDSFIPLKALLSPNLQKLISKNKRQFGERFTKNSSLPRPPEIQTSNEQESNLKRDISESLAKTSIDARGLPEVRSYSPKSFARKSFEQSWDYSKLSLANRIIFKKDRINHQANCSSEYSRLNSERSRPPVRMKEAAAQVLSSRSIGDRKPQYQSIKRRVSEARSPRLRYVPASAAHTYLYKEAERELNDLKSRFNMDRMVSQHMRDDRREGISSLKIISSSSMKLLTQIKY